MGPKKNRSSPTKSKHSRSSPYKAKSPRRSSRQKNSRKDADAPENRDITRVSEPVQSTVVHNSDFLNNTNANDIDINPIEIDRPSTSTMIDRPSTNTMIQDSGINVDSHQSTIDNVTPSLSQFLELSQTVTQLTQTINSIKENQLSFLGSHSVHSGNESRVSNGQISQGNITSNVIPSNVIITPSVNNSNATTSQGSCGQYLSYQNGIRSGSYTGNSGVQSSEMPNNFGQTNLNMNVSQNQSDQNGIRSVTHPGNSGVQSAEMPLVSDNAVMQVSGETGFEVFPSNQQNNGQVLQQVDQSVSQHLASFINQPSTSGPGNYTPNDKPVDYKVDDKTKQMIWNNQYINLANLLDPEAFDQDPSLNLVYSQNRSISLAPQKQKAIDNLGQWCSAFSIYLTVRCQKYPHELPQLMTYMNTVKNLAHRNGNYLKYDQEFRYLRQSDILPWNTTHFGLWSECRDSPNNRSNNTRSNRSKQHTNQSYNRNTSNNPQHPPGYCFRFHNGKNCSSASCKFKHCCYNSACNEANHSIIQCPQRGNSTTSKGQPNNFKQKS